MFLCSVKCPGLVLVTVNYRSIFEYYGLMFLFVLYDFYSHKTRFNLTVTFYFLIFILYVLVCYFPSYQIRTTSLTFLKCLNS